MQNHYHRYQIPPNFEICKIHKLANRIGDPSGYETCPCCQREVNVKPLSIFSKLKSFFYLGSGVYCQYVFHLSMICLLLIMFLTSGIYNLFINLNSEDSSVCEQYNNENEKSLVFRSSVQNRSKIHSFTSFEILNFLIIFIGYIFIVIIRKYQSSNFFKLDIIDDAHQEKLSFKDFTVWIHNLPKKLNDEQIKKLLESQKYNIPIKIAKITRSYQIRDLIKHQKRIEKNFHLIEQKMQIQEENRKSFIDKMHRQLLQSKNACEQFQIDIQGPRGYNDLFTGHAFISFENTEMKKEFLKHWNKLGIFKNTKIFNQFKILTKQLIVTDAPNAQDINWQHLDKKNSDVLKQKIKQYLIYAINIVFSGGVTLVIASMKYHVKKSHKNPNLQNQLILNLLSLFSAFVLFVCNFLFSIQINKICQQERFKKYSQFYSVYTKRYAVLQFVNAGVVLVCTYAIFYQDNYEFLCHQGGVYDQTFFYSLLLLELPFMQIILDKFWLKLKERSQKRLLKEGNHCYHTQQEANFVFQGLIYNPAHRYGKIGKVAMLGAFFAYSNPFSLVFAIITLILLFFTFKYSMINYQARPPRLGSELPNSLIIIFPELIIFIFSAGCYFWRSKTYYNESMVNLTLLQLIVSFIFMYVPLESILNIFIKPKVQQTPTTYWEIKQQMKLDYDTTNPAFSSIQEEFSQNGLDYILNSHKRKSKKAHTFRRLLSQDFEYSKKISEMKTSSLDLQNNDLLIQDIREETEKVEMLFHEISSIFCCHNKSQVKEMDQQNRISYDHSYDLEMMKEDVKNEKGYSSSKKDNEKQDDNTAVKINNISNLDCQNLQNQDENNIEN